MTVPDRRLVTKGVLQMLAAINWPVGDHTAPERVEGKGWLVVYSIPGGGYEYGSPLRSPDDTAQFTYQVDSVGLSREQAEWGADAVRRTFLARTGTGAFQVAFPNVLSGFKVIDRYPDGTPGGVTPEGTPPNRVFSNPERFVICVTPN